MNQRLSAQKTASTFPRLCAIALLTCAALQLTGCSNIVGATTDKPIESSSTSRSYGAAIDDEVIETTALVNIRKTNPALGNAHVLAISYNGVLLLAGQVPTEETRQLAGQAGSRVQNVKRVHNELTVGPNTELLVRTSDSGITTKIKSKLLTHKEAKSGKVKVVTENGVVYLMGVVTRSQADLASVLAQQTGGVQRVVRLFEYVD